MTSRTRTTSWIWTLVVVSALTAAGQAGAEDRAAAFEAFTRDVAPLLSRYCISCHGKEKQRADLNLEAYADLESVLQDRDRWELLQIFVEDGEMPPAGFEPRPTDEEAERISGWIQSTLSSVDCELVEPGRVTLRRLNRAEYNNTIRDLLGVDFEPAADFPSDEVGYGFDNIGDVLSVDPLLMEKYLDAAEEIAARAIDTVGPTHGPERKFWGDQLEQLGGAPHGDRTRILTSRGEFAVDHDFGGPATYGFLFSAFGDQAGDEPVKVALKVDGKVIETIEVKATGDDPGWYEVVTRLNEPAGRRRVALEFLNDYYEPEGDDQGRKDRNFILRGFEIRGPGDSIREFQVEHLGDDAGGARHGSTGRVLASSGEIGFDHDFPRAGEYRIRVLAFGQQAGPDPARLAFKVDGQTVEVADVFAVDGDPGTYEARLHVEPGTRRVAVAFLNDYYQPDHPDERQRGDRNLVVDEVTILGPVEAYYAENVPASHARIFAEHPLSGSEDMAIRSDLHRLAFRAFRRPVEEQEVDRLLELYRMVRRDGGTIEEAMQVALQGVLISPHFLFRVEYGGAPDPEASEGVRPLSDWELATRLSYFLWSSMPDDELFRLAGEGRLGDPAVLEAQAARMLADPKADALVANFAGQWLQLRNLEDLRPDRRRFRGFDDRLREAMARETTLFFGSIVREDRSIFELIDADYTFLNERLAKHYGIDGIQGDEFRKVALSADSPRGGVLTQASILTLTSNPTRTSPVKRGKYILEQILGTPPPSPPPDVPELKEGDELTGTLRERMEQHRANPACASCHNRMDPLGFGLENFDAIGRWRDRDGEDSIDASGALPDGTTFDGPRALKAMLVEARREDFARTFSEQLMTYALGRGLEYYDRCAVDQILDDLDRHEYRFGHLIAAIVTSDPFRFRKVEGSE